MGLGGGGARWCGPRNLESSRAWVAHPSKRTVDAERHQNDQASAARDLAEKELEPRPALVRNEYVIAWNIRVFRIEIERRYDAAYTHALQVQV